MHPPLVLSPGALTLHQGARVLDAWNLRWQDGPTPADAEPVSPLDAVRRLAQAGRLRRVPVGVIGPKAATPEQLDLAETLGRRLAGLGLAVLTGGRGGVMEAASRGAHEAGGLTIGIVPDDEWSAANAYVAMPLATGLGPARNAVVARACEVLIAVGGEYGTLSEMAFGMHFNRLVLALLNAPEVPGVRRCGIDEALERMALRLLRLDG